MKMQERAIFLTHIPAHVPITVIEKTRYNMGCVPTT